MRRTNGSSLLPHSRRHKHEYADAELSASSTLVRDVSAERIIRGFEKALAGAPDGFREIFKPCGIERQPGGYRLHACGCIPGTEEVVLQRLGEPPQVLQCSVE